MPPAPEPLALGVELDRPQIVDVGAFGVEELAQKAAPHHPQDHHLAPAVTTVLHHDAVAERVLGGFNQLPTAVDGVGRGHLGGDVFAGFHRRDTHRHVPLPGRGGEHQVEIVALTEPQKIPITAGVKLRLPLPRRLHPAGHFLGASGIEVADRHDLDTVDLQEILDVTAPLEADADEAHAHPLERRRGEASGCGVG